MAPDARARYIALRQRVGCVRLSRGLRITSELVGNPPEDKPTLIVSNHIGTLDPWILATHLDVSFVAKSEMGTWPVISWVCKAVGIIFAHRGRITKAEQTVDEIRQRMRAGVSVLIFPEGTTSDGTGLLPFKAGGLQSVAGMDDGYIVPVYFHVRSISGVKVDESSRQTVTWSSPQGMFENIWHVLGLGRLHYVIRVGDPIPAAGKNRKTLAEESFSAVSDLMSAELSEIGATKRNEVDPVRTQEGEQVLSQHA